jgi:hypothetical protein
MQKTSPPSVTVDQQGAEQGVTDEAIASFADSGSPRYREVMQSLVRHLHSFARDVRLTTGEWEAAIGFLTRTGHITNRAAAYAVRRPGRPGLMQCATRVKPS